MLDNFIYENHLGQRFVGRDNGVFLNANDLRDYSWKYDTINSRISRFYRPVKDRSLPLVVACNTSEEAIAVKHRLLELTETDIEARLPGKVYIGEYYTNGYITSSSKSNYLTNGRFCNVSLKLTSDDPAWYRDTAYSFGINSGDEGYSEGGTDYTYDYPYDYAVSITGKKIVCNSIGSNAFKLLIYGPAAEPTIMIGGNTYTVNGTIGAGEVLLINSITKTITLTTAAGQSINWFDRRGRDSYIFEPIPAGQNTVVWPGSFGFDLTVVEKRSEPQWT